MRNLSTTIFISRGKHFTPRISLKACRPLFRKIVTGSFCFYPSKQIKRVAVIVSLAMCFGLSVYSQTWTGNVSTAWEDVGNWATGVLPTASTDATIPASPSGGRFPTISTGTYPVKDLIVAAGATVTQTGGTLQVANEWRNSGTYNATAGTVQFTGNGGGATNFAAGTNNLFHVIVNTGVDPNFDNVTASNINIAGDFTNNNAALAAQNSNSSFTFTGSANQNFYTAATNAICGALIINKTSGTVTQTSAIKVINLTMTAGTYSTGASNYTFTATGTATFNGGTFNVNASTVAVTGTWTTNGGTISGTTCTISTGDYVRNSLSLAASSGTLSVAGNWTNSVTGVDNIATVTFTGALKTISGTATGGFPTLAITGTVTMNNSNSCAELDFPTNANDASLTLGSGVTLSVSGDVTLDYPSADKDILFNINSATVNVSGNVNIGGNIADNGRITKIVMTTGTLDITGNLVFNAASGMNVTAAVDMSGGAGLLRMNGSFVLTNGAGTLTPGTTSTVEFYGTSAQTISGAGALSYNTIKVNKSSGTVTQGANLTATGNLQIDQGSFTTSASNYSLSVNSFVLNGGSLSLNNSTVTASGAYTNNGTTVTGGTCTVTINGDLTNNNGSFTAASGTLTLGGSWVNNHSGTFSINTITFTGTTKTIGGTNTTVFPDATITTGSYTVNTNASFASLTLANNNVANSLTISDNITVTVSGNVVVNQPATTDCLHSLNANGGTLTVSGSLTLSVTINDAGRIAQLAITSGTVNITGDLILTNTFNAASSVINMSGGAGTLNLSGNFTVNSLGTLTPGTTSTVVLKGTGNQTITDVSAISYNHLKIDKPSGTATIGAALNIGGTLIIAQGTFTTSASYYAVTATGMTLTGGTFSIGNSVVTINGDVLSSGGSLTTGTGSFSVSGNWTNNGGSIAAVNVTFTGVSKTIGGSAGTSFGLLTFAAGTTYSLDGTQTTTGITFNASATASSLTQLSGSALTVNGNVTINQPTASSITTAWNINAGTATVNGSVIIGGTNTTLTRIAKVVITTGSLDLNGNLVYNSSATTPQTAVVDISGGAGILYISGSFTLTNATGTLTPGTSSKVVFDGNAAQTLVSSSAISFNTVEVNKTGNSLSLGAATILTGDLILTQGSFSNAGYSLTVGGNWTNNGGTFSYNATSDDVIFNGASQSINGTNSTTFPTMLIDNGGNVTMNNDNTCYRLEFLTGTGVSSSFTHAGTAALTVTNEVMIRQIQNTSVNSSWNINAGSATVNGAVKIGTGNDSNNSGRVAKVVITTGTLNVTGNMIFYANPSHPGNALLDLTSGGATVNVTGSVMLQAGGWTGTISPGTNSLFNFNGSSAQTITFGSQIKFNNIHINNTAGVTAGAAFTATNVTGNLRVQTGSFSNGGFAITGASGKTFEVANGASFIVAGTTGMVTGFTTKTFGATSTVNYTGTTQTISAETYGHLTISGARATSNVTLASSGTIAIAGTFTASATFTSGTYVTTGSTVHFNGSSSQNIPAFTFNNLTISGSTSKAATGAVTVNGVFTMTSSVLNTTSSNVLVLNDNATASGAGLTAYVNGPVRKVGNDAFTFPVGKSGTGYMPISISAPAAGTDAFTAEYMRSSATALGTVTSPGLYRVSNCDYWNLVRTTGTSSVNVTLSWNGYSNCNIAAYVTNIAAITVAHFNGTNWDSHGSNSTSGNASSGTVTRNNVSTFSPFSLGSTDDYTNPLQLQFTSLTANRVSGGVKVDWVNLNENDLDHYVVEKSLNGSDFYPVQNVSLNPSQKYSCVDGNAETETIYYRIKALDKPGQPHYSGIVKVGMIEYDGKILVYPSPVRNGNITVEAKLEEKGSYLIEIFGMNGEFISSYRSVHSGGSFRQTIRLPETIKTGVYNLRIQKEGEILFRRQLIVQ